MLWKSISDIDYKKLRPRGSSFGVLYGLWKTQEKVLDKCLHFRPILPTIKAPAYKLEAFLVPLIEPITKENWQLNKISELSKVRCEQNSEYFKVSLDATFFFPNIPWEEIIKLSNESLYQNQELLSDINKSCALQQLLFFFFFDGIIYQQVDVVAMGSKTQ